MFFRSGESSSESTDISNLEIEKEESEDIYDTEPGKSFRGTCVKCERNTIVRNIKTSERSTTGPYDRYCAYETVIGKIPPYVTKPSTFTEVIYQTITKKELPPHHRQISIFLRRFVITVVVIVIGFLLINIPIFSALTFSKVRLDLILIWVLLFAFNLLLLFTIDELPDINDHVNLLKLTFFNDVDDEASVLEFILFLSKVFIATLVWGPLLFLNFFTLLLLPFAAGYLLSIIALFFFPFLIPAIIKSLTNHDTSLGMTILAMRNFEGYGKDHIEHFNMIWDGKIDRKTRPLSEMKKQSWIFVLKVIFATINVVSYLIIYYVYLNNSITILLGLYYPIVLFFVMYASTDFFGVISALLPDEDYRELPDDIYQEMIGRYFDYNLKDPSIQENQKDFLKILQSQERKLRVWQISCPICKTDIREGDDLLIQCQVCQRVYHETHLQSYFDNQSSSDKNCVVCQTKIMDAFQEFVILKG